MEQHELENYIAYKEKQIEKQEQLLEEYRVLIDKMYQDDFKMLEWSKRSMTQLNALFTEIVHIQGEVDMLTSVVNTETKAFEGWAEEAEKYLASLKRERGAD